MSGEFQQREPARQRLLYDDTAPRMRRPVNPTVLKFRRPGVLVVPITIITAVGVPALLAALPLSGALGASLSATTVGIAGFIALALGIALLLARREEKTFALLTPNLLSTSHALLLIALLIGLFARGPMTSGPVAWFLDAVPGPALDSPGLELLKAYCLLFVVVTAASLGAAVVFRVLGLRRVVAGSA